MNSGESKETHTYRAYCASICSRTCTCIRRTTCATVRTCWRTNSFKTKIKSKFVLSRKG